MDKHRFVMGCWIAVCLGIVAYVVVYETLHAMDATQMMREAMGFE